MERSIWGWLRIGIIIVLAVNLVREGIVWLFDVRQLGAIRIAKWYVLVADQIHPVLWVIGTVIGTFAVLAMTYILFEHKQKDESPVAVRNVRIAAAAGLIGAMMTGDVSGLLMWTEEVALVTAIFGCLLGAEKTGHEGLYMGFGIVFGAVVYHSMVHGFLIAGLLAIVAFNVGGIAAMCGYLLGCALVPRQRAVSGKQGS